MHVACCVNCVQEVVDDSLRVLMVNAFLDYTTAMALLTAWMPVMNVIAASLTLLWYCNVKRTNLNTSFSSCY